MHVIRVLGRRGLMQANFHEKAHFVKADVAALEIVVERNGCVFFALCFHPHF